MPEEKKRQAHRTRTAGVRPAKGARRRSRTGTGPRRSDARLKQRQYGNGVSITVQIPQLRRPRKSQISALTALLRRRIVIIPALAALLILIAASVQLTGNKQTTPSVAAADKTQANFQVLTPPSAEQTSARKYDSKRSLVTYTTTFSGTRMTVSQQELPVNFAKDPAALLKVADSVHAKDRLDTAKGPLYIATNDKGADQLAVYAAPKILLMIHTDRTLDKASWKSFIELLEENS